VLEKLGFQFNEVIKLTDDDPGTNPVAPKG